MMPAHERTRGTVPVEALHDELHPPRYARRCLSIVRRHAAAGLLIDVGSSTNPFPNLAEKAGFDVTVLDHLLPPGLSPSIRFREGGIRDEGVLAQLEGVFDVVTAWGVIEHLPEPKVPARALSRLCRPGGRLFLSTPEVGTFLTRHVIGRSTRVHRPEPLYLQSPRTVAQVFEQQGCRLVTWGRLEPNALRHAARYASGLAQTLGGLAVKAVLPSAWQALRNGRHNRFKGIVYFVLERR